MENHKQNNINSTVRSFFKVMTGNISGLIIGLASNIIIAWAFGAGADMDAYLTALVVPLYIGAVLNVGLSFVLIPAFIDRIEKGDEESAWALVGSTLWVTGGFLSILALVGILFSPNLITLIAPGLNPQKAELSAQMLRIMMITVPFTGVGSLTIGVQNARGSFFVPAVAPTIGSLGNMVILWFGHTLVGPMALAYGNLFSIFIQSIITTFPVARHGWKYLIPIRDPLFLRLLRLAAPLILFGLLTRITPVFERYFASGLPNGELSYLGYANKVSAIVLAVFGTPIATVIFPEMARRYATLGRDGLKNVSSQGINTTMIIAVPVLVISSVIQLPLIRVLFERGAFNLQTSVMVSRIIPLVLIVVVCQMLGNVLGRTFYVLGDTITVPASASFSSLLYLLIIYLIIHFSTLDYFGLALTQTIQWVILIIWLTVILSIRKLLYTNKIVISALKILLCSIAGGLVAYFLLSTLRSSPSFIQVLIPGFIGLVVYILFLYLVDRDTFIKYRLEQVTNM